MIEIVNVSENWAIGKKGTLLVTIPEDMQFFRKTTKGHVCIMGSNTLESFPGKAPLKDRINIVLIDDPAKICPESVAAARRDQEEGRSTELLYVRSPEEAAEATAAYPDRKTFVIGGASVYRLMLPFCDTCLVTRNSLRDPEADTFYPDLDQDPAWVLSESSGCFEWNGIQYRFCTYRKII